MLVNMIPMHVVQMAVMNIVDVTIMADRGVAAGRSVLMGMVGMLFFVTSGHRLLFLIVLLGSGRLDLIFVLRRALTHFALIEGHGRRRRHRRYAWPLDVVSQAAPHGAFGDERIRSKAFPFELREFRDADFTLAEPRQQPEPS
jgi:hypothetical protein